MKPSEIEQLYQTIPYGNSDSDAYTYWAQVARIVRDLHPGDAERITGLISLLLETRKDLKNTKDLRALDLMAQRDQGKAIDALRDERTKWARRAIALGWTDKGEGQ